MTAPSAVPVKTGVDAIVQQVLAQPGLSRAHEAQLFTENFFRQVPADDIACRDAASWARLTMAMFEFMRERRSGQSKIRVFNPVPEQDGMVLHIRPLTLQPKIHHE